MFWLSCEIFWLNEEVNQKKKMYLQEKAEIVTFQTYIVLFAEKFQEKVSRSWKKTLSDYVV